MKKEIRHSTNTTFNYITGDFENIWDALNGCGKKEPGGNYNFMVLSMIFLEWTCTIIENNKYLHKRFSRELYKRNPKYFLRLNSKKITGKYFTRPFLKKSDEGYQLLDIIISLHRNGIAHMYTPYETYSKNGFRIIFSVNMSNLKINELEKKTQVDNIHLIVDKKSKIINIPVNPGLLYLDIKHAFLASKILQVKKWYKLKSKSHFDNIVLNVKNHSNYRHAQIFNKSLEQTVSVPKIF